MLDACRARPRVLQTSADVDIPNFFDTCAIIYVERNVAVSISLTCPNRWENSAMSKPSSKNKRRSKALPALGFAGVSLSMASGACASTSEARANTPPTAQSQSHEVFLGDEEISDVSLATFYVFDKENTGPPPLAQQLRLARGGCGGCGCGHGGGGGCGGGGCRCGGGGGGCGGGGCRCGGGIHMGCGGCHVACRGCRCGGFGCGGCGGWGGNCWIWTPLWPYSCWGESTPPAKVSDVASEPSAQTAEAAGKGDGNIDGTRTK